MSVLRGIRDRRFKFTQVLNSMLEDEKISLKAKGFITYCLSKPDAWKFYISHLSSKLKEGEKAIYSTIDECIENGYAIRYQGRKENGGDFASWETIISDSKEEISLLKEELKNDPDFQKMFALRRFGDAQDAHPQNGPPSNTNGLDIHKEQQQQKAAAPPAAVPIQQKLYPCLESLVIPESDKYQIAKAYPEDVVKNAVAWATHPETKINKSLAQAIKWACKEKPELPKLEKDVFLENKAAAEKIVQSIKVKPDYINIEVLGSKIEIVFNSQRDPICIEFKEKSFKEMFVGALKKVGVILNG